MDMTITKEMKKEAIKAVEEATGQKARYMGVPSCAYQIGAYRIEKDGTITADEKPEDWNEVMKAYLTAIGAHEEETNDELIDLVVEVPFDKVDIDNLGKLIDAKGKLIRKALGIEETTITADPEKVTFAWFHQIEKEKAKAYTDFIAALCGMSINQKRISAKETEVPNEKYAFRCFLLRLGFIGPEYKADRKILLENLEGSSAFKSGKRGGDEE